MKKLTLLLLFQWAFFAFSQTETDWKNVTFKDAAFFGALNTKENIVQKDKTGELTRILTPFENKLSDVYLRYVLNCYNKEGIVEESQYILSKIGIPKDFDLFKIQLNSADVLFYDLFADKDYKYEENRGFKMVVKVNGEEVGLNNPMASYYQPCDNGGFSLCDEWYAIEYYVDNGEIISITPLGTICLGCIGGGGIAGGGGGGGNSTPPDPQLTCEEKTEAYANEGNSMNGPVTEDPEIFINQYTRKKPYNWKIYSAGAWGLLSYEEATVERVQYVGTSYQYRWEYVDFIHKRIAAVGSNFGGTRTFEDLGATINISPTKTKASVRIDFSVTSKILDAPIPCPDVTIPYNANKDFFSVQVEVE